MGRQRWRRWCREGLREIGGEVMGVKELDGPDEDKIR